MISIKLDPKGDRHREICARLREMFRASARAKNRSERVKKWRENEELFVGYIPEKESDRLRRQKRESGTPEYTTIQLPYSYAVAMAAHSYFTSVFLSRSPIFQFMGNSDEGEMQVLALEALMNYQVFGGRQRPQLYILLQDVVKYGEAWISPYWREDRSRVSRIVEKEEMFLGMIPTGKMVKTRITEELLEYQGNALYNIHPAKVFTDPRYPRQRFQEGEFVAIETTLSRNQLVIGEERGQYINVDTLGGKKSSDYSTEGEVVYEESNAPILETPGTDDWSSHIDKTASDVGAYYEFCIDLIPKLWKFGKSTLPEKWVFTVTKDFRTIVEARPLGNYHNRFPLAMIEVEPEGYATYSRSLLEVFTPIQNTLDWLVNSHLFNVRQVLNNNWIGDPSRIEMRDFTSQQGNPGKFIRLKPAAYGTDVRTALQQLPVTDVTRSHLADMSMMYDLGERLGINDQVMGMSHPSSRRSAQEIRGTQAFGISRLKTMTEYFSATGFSDLASMMVKNSQQFFNTEMKIRIAGEAAMIAGDQFINVTPEMIAGQFTFEPVDGTLPADRFAQANLWRTIIGEMASVPAVFMQYDLGKIFGYVAQLSGVKNLNRFKIEVVPDQTVIQAAQLGNAVPARGSPANILEPGQVQGVGPTA